MRKFIKRLFCAHIDWDCIALQKKIIFSYSPEDTKVPWRCRACGKVKYFTASNPPIQKM